MDLAFSPRRDPSRLRSRNTSFANGQREPIRRLFINQLRALSRRGFPNGLERPLAQSRLRRRVLWQAFDSLPEHCELAMMFGVHSASLMADYLGYREDATMDEEVSSAD